MDEVTTDAGDGSHERGLTCASPPPVILVIEPSLTLRTLIPITLRRAGNARVFAFPDTLAALRSLRRGLCPPPYLVLLTRSLSSGDGYRELRALRHGCPDAVIVLVMEDEGALERIKARMSGAATVLLKPYTVADLLRLVQSAVSEARQKPTVFRP